MNKPARSPILGGITHLQRYCIIVFFTFFAIAVALVVYSSLGGNVSHQSFWWDIVKGMVAVMAGYLFGANMKETRTPS